MVKGDREWIFPEMLRSAILGEVKPGPEESGRIIESTEELLGRITTSLGSKGRRDVEPLLAGSIAKGTVSANPDIDVFLVFPSSTDDDDLEKTGLETGREVLDHPRKRYTQHPYITGAFSGFSVDIVPCRRIERGEKVSTAVDRTPYHTEYINSRMDPRQKDDTILLKSFLKGIGSYGAEDTVTGFSGYLCELLVLMNGSFSGVINWFSSFHLKRNPPGQMERTNGEPYLSSTPEPFTFPDEPLLCEKPEPVQNYKRTFDGASLIIIDPVDPGRNVAAPVSEQLLAHTIYMSGMLMENPSRELFHPWRTRPLKHDSIGIHGPPEREFMLDLPDENPDKVMTQTRSFLTKAVREMERRFRWKVTMDHILLFPPGSKIDPAYLRSRYTHESEAVDNARVVVRIITEPEVPETEEIHWGPPADHVRAAEFRKRWKERTRLDDATGKLFVVIEKEPVEPTDLLMDIWENLRKGPSFRESVPEPVENQLIHEVIWEASEGRSIPSGSNDRGVNR